LQKTRIVIPAKAGIQYFQYFLDPRFRGGDSFLSLGENGVRDDLMFPYTHYGVIRKSSLTPFFPELPDPIGHQTIFRCWRIASH
jgi:hypothetical protein